MKTMPISWISSYLYCKRKLYLEKSKKDDEIYLVKRKLRQKIYDSINSVDEELVKSIRSFKTLEDVNMLFRQRYYELVQTVINNNRDKLESGADFFHEVWPSVLKEINLRSENVFEFMMKEKVYSSELWSKLFPKYLSEVYLENKKLKGFVDRIEIYPDFMVPVYLKKGKAPKEGVWPSDRAIVEAQMILIAKEFGRKVNHGFVNYLESEEIRKVQNNEFVVEFIDGLLEDIDKSLNGSLPGFVKNRKKCEKCSLKEKCYGFEK